MQFKMDIPYRSISSELEVIIFVFTFIFISSLLSWREKVAGGVRPLGYFGMSMDTSWQ